MSSVWARLGAFVRISGGCQAFGAGLGGRRENRGGNRVGAGLEYANLRIDYENACPARAFCALAVTRCSALHCSDANS